MTTISALLAELGHSCRSLPRSIMIAAIITSASIMPLCGCEGVSDNLPSAVITAKTAGILRISTTGLSSQNIQQSADALATIMSKSTIPQIVQASGMLQLQAVGIKENPSMMKMDDTMAALRQINAKAIYIVADRDAAGNMTDALTSELPLAAKGVIFLVQTTSTNSQSDIQSVAAKIFGASVIVDSIGHGWYWLKSDAKDSLPTDTDAVSAQEFDRAITALPSSAISFGMRMTPELRETFNAAMEEDSGPMTMFLTGFQEPMKSLNTISAAVEFGPHPTIRAALNFSAKESAAEFGKTWNTTTRSVAGMAGMMLSAPDEDGKGGIDPKVFTKMAEALDMTQNETQLTLTLDDAGWKKLFP